MRTTVSAAHQRIDRIEIKITLVEHAQHCRKAGIGNRKAAANQRLERQPHHTGAKRFREATTQPLDGNGCFIVFLNHTLADAWSCISPRYSHLDYKPQSRQKRGTKPSPPSLAQTLAPGEFLVEGPKILGYKQPQDH